jgi:hypothetical protein
VYPYVGVFEYVCDFFPFCFLAAFVRFSLACAFFFFLIFVDIRFYEQFVRSFGVLPRMPDMGI